MWKAEHFLSQIQYAGKGRVISFKSDIVSTHKLTDYHIRKKNCATFVEAILHPFGITCSQSIGHFLREITLFYHPECKCKSTCSTSQSTELMGNFEKFYRENIWQKK